MFLDLTIAIKNISTFFIGCCFGSFVNVIVYRLPLGKSVIFPRSQCITCNYKIRWYENIPLISWILLGGICSNCGKKISWVYPIIELTSGLLFVLNNYSLPSNLSISSGFISTLLGWFFISSLLSLAILDMKYFWLPDSISIFGISFGILSSLLVGILYNSSDKTSLLFDSIFAAFLGYLVFQIISLIGLKIYKKPAMGKGDAKLSALIGSWLGVKGLGITIWLAFNIAGIFVIIGLLLKSLKRNQKIPFGSFLALSALLVWHFGNNTFLRIMYLA